MASSGPVDKLMISAMRRTIHWKLKLGPRTCHATWTHATTQKWQGEGPQQSDCCHGYVHTNTLCWWKGQCTFLHPRTCTQALSVAPSDLFNITSFKHHTVMPFYLLPTCGRGLIFKIKVTNRVVLMLSLMFWRSVWNQQNRNCVNLTWIHAVFHKLSDFKLPWR